MFPTPLALAARAVRSEAVAGYGHFVTPLRKLIFDYDDRSPAQVGVKKYLEKPLLEMAKENPDVEVIVRNLGRGRSAVIRGHYGEST